MVKKTKGKDVKEESYNMPINSLEVKRNNLINSIQKILLTKAQLKRGGGEIRGRYERERGYLAVIDEINELGKKLGHANIGLGDLRR